MNMDMDDTIKAGLHDQPEFAGFMRAALVGMCSNLTVEQITRIRDAQVTWQADTYMNEDELGEKLGFDGRGLGIAHDIAAAACHVAEAAVMHLDFQRDCASFVVELNRSDLPTQAELDAARLERKAYLGEKMDALEDQLWRDRRDRLKKADEAKSR